MKTIDMDIKDSGIRRSYGAGKAVRDDNGKKGRMDLLPWMAIIEVSKHCQRGAEKYQEHNVDLGGIPLSSFCDSAARHLGRFLSGHTDEDHLLAAAWNLLYAVQTRLVHPEDVDVPWKADNVLFDDDDACADYYKGGLSDRQRGGNE